MTNLNRVVLVGRLTANPEILNTVEGGILARFTLAVDRPIRPDGTRDTDFINIVSFGRLAELSSEYLSKGRLVLIEGRIQNRSYQTPEGTKRYQVEVVANKLRILDSKRTEPAELELEKEVFPEEEENLKDAEFVFDESDLEGIEGTEVPF